MPLLVLWPKKLLHPLSQMVSCHNQSFTFVQSDRVMTYSWILDFGCYSAVKAEMPLSGSKLNCAHFTLSYACVNGIFQASKNCQRLAIWPWKGFHILTWMLGHVHLFKSCMLYFMNLSASSSNNISITSFQLPYLFLKSIK